MSRKRKKLAISNYGKFPVYKLGKKKTSGLEKKFEKKVMDKLGFDYKKQYEVGGKAYDFAYPQFRILIEVDGDYWHGKDGKILNKMQKMNRRHDKKKDKIALINNFDLIRFRERDVNDRIQKVRFRLSSLILAKK